MRLIWGHAFVTKFPGDCFGAAFEVCHGVGKIKRFHSALWQKFRYLEIFTKITKEMGLVINKIFVSESQPSGSAGTLTI